MRVLTAVLTMFFSCFAMVGQAHAAFPDRQITLIVPLVPGGTADVLGRLVAQRLSEKYGQSVVVENRSGAGGNIGAAMVARSAPDGYTLLLGTMGIHASYGIYSNLKYDPSKELTTIAVLAELPNALIANPSFPAKTVKEVIALANDKSRQVFYGSAGHGSSTHMSAELFKHLSKAPVEHIPYKGSAAALADLVGGRLNIMFENLPTALPLIRNGDVRAIAVTSGDRAASLPDVPTIREQGLSDYVFTAWMTLAAPSGTPRAVLEKLNKDVAEVMKSDALRSRLKDLGMTPVVENLDATAAYIAAEKKKFDEVIAAANLKVD